MTQLWITANAIGMKGKYLIDIWLISIYINWGYIT